MARINTKKKRTEELQKQKQNECLGQYVRGTVSTPRKSSIRRGYIRRNVS